MDQPEKYSASNIQYGRIDYSTLNGKALSKSLTTQCSHLLAEYWKDGNVGQ